MVHTLPLSTASHTWVSLIRSMARRLREDVAEPQTRSIPLQCDDFPRHPRRTTPAPGGRADARDPGLTRGSGDGCAARGVAGDGAAVDLQHAARPGADPAGTG